MYGGSGKLGRGGGARGGGGLGKRNNLHSTFHQPPPLHRPSSSSAAGGRLSVGGAAGTRNRNTTSGPSTSAPSTVEETFSLVTGNPLDFAMIIRLAPDLVDEIKRVEAQGGTARIKFDSNANNPSGNVIDVGGKDFRFTWSREMGDLCDIYEERQSGEDGNGLLVESGCAWRKLNVQRILDESTKNHVKMRSEEAERKLKSRKAIILDHGNPSMKNQMKALAAAESNPWRKPFKQKEPEFKKRKIETPPVAVGGPPKSAYKYGLPSTTPAKGRPSVSPLPSPPEHSGAPASPLGTGNLTKAHTSVEDVTPIQVTSKENPTSSEKEMPNRATTGAAQEKPVRKGNLGAKPMDLQSMLISLLMEKRNGMSLKALEKAIGDTIPNSVKKIEPIIKKIATFQAPGRYILKPGVELENFNKPLSESGSSPEDNHHQTPALVDKRDDIPAPTPNFAEKAGIEELEKQAQLNSNIGEELNSSLEKIDIQHHSPDIVGDKKVSDNSEGPAGSSSDSGSDSDSESDSSDSGTDSGSHSRSRSKSRSPVGSGSGSSSDSESDASSNSKQGPDEDVDIMTSDDEKELEPKLRTSEPRCSTSPIPLRTSDGGLIQNGIDEKQDGNGSDVVEIENTFPGDDQETEMAVVANSISNKAGEKPVEDVRLSLPGHQEHQESQVYTGNLFSERENIAKDGFKHEQTDSSGRIFKGKSKRGSDSKRIHEKSEHAKRVKAGSFPQPELSRGRDSLFSETLKVSPDRVIEDPYKGHSTQVMNRASRDGNADSGLQKGYNQGIPVKSIMDSQNSGRRPVDLSARVKAPDTAERPGVHAESLGCGIKYSERNRHSYEGLPIQKDKVSKEIQDEGFYTKEKKMPRNSKEGAFGDKHSTHFDPYYYGKHGELGGKLKEAGEVSNSHMGYSPKDNSRIDVERSPVINGRGKILQRELSDLELGELREPLPEETPGVKKEFERKSSFKQSENKPSTSDYWNSDLSKGKPTGKTTADSGKPSPPHLRVGVPRSPEGSSKRRTPEHHAEDLTRPHHRVVQSQPQGPPQPLSRVDRPEIGNKKLADVSGKLRHNEAGASGAEGYGDTHKKASVSAPQQHDTKRGPSSHPPRESKTQKSNTLADLIDVRNDTSLTESNEGVLKRRESSSDENSCSYSKYEKEEPELKGPIKDFCQYKEFVEEYREKYDSYCSLNKTLESYRYYENFTCSCSRFGLSTFIASCLVNAILDFWVQLRLSLALSL